MAVNSSTECKIRQRCTWAVGMIPESTLIIWCSTSPHSFYLSHWVFCVCVHQTVVAASVGVLCSLVARGVGRGCVLGVVAVGTSRPQCGASTVRTNLQSLCCTGRVLRCMLNVLAGCPAHSHCWPSRLSFLLSFTSALCQIFPGAYHRQARSRVNATESSRCMD